MQTKTPMSLILSPRTRFACSMILLFVSLMQSARHPSFMVLTGFFALQIFVKLFTKNGTNMPFLECLLVGPLKLLVSGVTVMFALIADSTSGGLVWISLSLLFLFSGMQNMYWIISGDYDFDTAPNGFAPKVTRQDVKAAKEEEQLLSDLFSSLDDTDFADKEK